MNPIHSSNNESGKDFIVDNPQSKKNETSVAAFSVEKEISLSNNSENTFQQRVSEITGFIIFMIMGSAPNWVFATALAQEIPFFEQSDGLCIATYMNAVRYRMTRKMILFPFVYSLYDVSLGYKCWPRYPSSIRWLE